jgi:serine/threonine protein kinase
VRSVVWGAEDTALARRVAVKQIRLPAGLGPTDRAAALARVGRRAQAVSALSHPNVIALYDVVEDGGFGWLVMELVPWPSLADVIAAHGALASDFVATVGLGVLGGLDAAHELAIVHGDVNPANVLVATDGHVKLTDFGIARAASGPMSGTPAFRAPEVLAGATADARADLWGLGATMATALRGVEPFGAGTTDPERIAASIRSDATPAIDADTPLAFAVNGLLRKDPAHRLGSGGARQALLEAGGVDLNDPRQSAQRGDDRTTLLAAALEAEPETTRLAAQRPIPEPPAPQPSAVQPPLIASAPRQQPTPPAAVQTPPAGQPPQPHPAAARPTSGPNPPPPIPTRPSPPAPSRGPKRRRRRSPGVTAAAIALVVVLCAGVAYGAFWITDTLGGKHNTAERLATDPTSADPLGGIGRNPTNDRTGTTNGTTGAASGTPSSSAPTASSPTSNAPSSSTSPSAAGSALPDGYTTYHDSRGFTVGAPQGWKAAVSPSNKHVVDLTAPDGQRFLRLVVSPATSGSLGAEFAAAEKEFKASHKGYHRVQLTTGTFRGHDSVLWEFTFNSSGTVRHARYLDFTAGGKEYGVYVSAPDAQFSSMDKVYQVALDTISVP